MIIVLILLACMSDESKKEKNLVIDQNKTLENEITYQSNLDSSSIEESFHYFIDNYSRDSIENLKTVLNYPFYLGEIVNFNFAIHCDITRFSQEESSYTNTVIYESNIDSFSDILFSEEMIIAIESIPLDSLFALGQPNSKKEGWIFPLYPRQKLRDSAKWCSDYTLHINTFESDSIWKISIKGN